MPKPLALILAGAAGLLGLAPASAQEDLRRGAALFQQCAACHSLAAGRHLTGPSLAGVVGRKAGTAPGFGRYSAPLRDSGLVWNRGTLDRWLADPAALVPGNAMAFAGIGDARARADLIAYLTAASEGKDVPAPARGMAMMGQGERLILKQAAPDRQVTAIRYCPDAYRVSTAAGKTFTFWERNLRLKTDSSAEGPLPGKPVLLHAGMMGDRAFVVFAAPEEISALIRRECPG
jgi:cytochrome c